MDTSPFNTPDAEAEKPAAFSFGTVSPAETEPEAPEAETETETETEAPEVETESETETEAESESKAGDKIPKRAPTDLEGDVLTAIKHVTQGTIQLPDDKKLTPHTVAKLVENDRGDDQPVSTGAVSDCFKRWEKLGFIELDEKPIAFASFVAGDSKEYLDDLKVARREKLAADRAAAKAAKAAEKEAEKATESGEPEAAEPEAAEPAEEATPEAVSETADPAGF